MTEEHAQLSSAATGLDELVKRVVEAAERLHVAGRDDLAGDLFEVERSLQAAARRLAGVVRALG